MLTCPHTFGVYTAEQLQFPGVQKRGVGGVRHVEACLMMMMMILVLGVLQLTPPVCLQFVASLLTLGTDFCSWRRNYINNLLQT